MNLGEKAERALRIAREDVTIAYDTETSGLNWRIHNPVGHVITSGSTGESLYIPIRHGGGGNLLCHENQAASAPLKNADDPVVIHSFEKELAKVFEERNQKHFYAVTHNGKFDAHMAANVGIMLGRNLYDTGVTQALINEFTKKWSLEDIAKEYKVEAKKSEPMYQYLAEKFGGEPSRKLMSEFWRTYGGDKMPVEYAEGDGITTIQIHREQMKKIHEEYLEFIFNLESKLIWTLFRIERRGVKVDLEYCTELRKTIDAEIKKASEKLPEGFNTRSPRDVYDFIVSTGRTDWPITEKGNPSFTEHWLKTFPEGRLILEHRRWTNIGNTFLDPLVGEHVYEGRVHPTINQTKGDEYGTISGRLSCSNPNLQQLPKRNKAVAKPFRKAFVADEGFWFGERDWSQCEPRLFAHYSKEKRLIDGYNADPPEDMHQATADLFGVERDPTAKRMNMGILTGMYPKAFAGHMDWELDYAKDMWNRWFEAYPGIKNFQDTASRVFAQRGYVRTLLGRRCRLEKPRFAYRAVSRIIQGGNADILKHKMVEVDEYLESVKDRTHFLMTVHDSFVYQFPKGEDGAKDHVAIGRIMEDVMTPPFNLSVPFVTDSGFGANWSEATFGVEK